MLSADDQNHHDHHDFLAFGNDPWPMTAELIEMAQYLGFTGTFTCIVLLCSLIPTV